MIECIDDSTTGTWAQQENPHHNLECIGSPILKEKQHADDDNNHLRAPRIGQQGIGGRLKKCTFAVITSLPIFSTPFFFS